MKKILFFLLIVLATAACTTTKTVTVERTTHDTLWHERHIRDSIYLHDSINVIQEMKGDTFFVTKERWHVAYRDRWRTDSVYVSVIDSVPVPYPVEAKLTRWQKMQIDLWKVILGLIAVFIIAYVGKKKLKL